MYIKSPYGTVLQCGVGRREIEQRLEDLREHIHNGLDAKQEWQLHPQDAVHRAELDCAQE